MTDEARFIRKSWFRCVREVCDLEMDKCKVAMDEVKTKKVTVLMLKKAEPTDNDDNLVKRS